MAHLDPDQVIGRLAGARLGRVPAQAGEVCPDAEVLAAYADGGLSPDEIARLDAHLADCAVCRRMLATLMPESAGGIAAEPAPAGAVILPFRRRRVFVYLSAAAGLLAALTLWSVARLSEPARSTRMASVPAERDAGGSPMPAAPPPADVPATGTASRSAAADTLSPTDAAKPAGASAGAAPLRQVEEVREKAGQGRRDRDLAAKLARDNEAKKLADAAVAASLDERTAQVTNQRPITAQTNTVIAGVSRPRGPLSQQAANVGQSQNVAQVPPPLAASASPPPAPESERSPVPAPVPATAAPARPAEAERRAEAPAVTGGEASGRVNAGADSRLAKEETASRFRRDPEAAGVAGARAAFSTAGAPAVRTFAEPDGRLLWRIADGTRLESSSDGGTTWTERHRSQTRLHDGSAPSIDVAWAVGDGGLVLRRAVPGGWAAVAPPAAVALVGISATSADTARVTAADGRVFETADGGRTWTSASGAAPR